MTVLPSTQIVIGPNASMTARAACILMAAASSASLSIAALFAIRGFWPVLPFAGLELAALAAAIWVSLRRNRYQEVIRFDAQMLHIECGVRGHGVHLRVDWPRSSTRVMCEPPTRLNDPIQLQLVNAGCAIQLAACLTDEDKLKLATRLRELIHPGWISAPSTSSRVVSADFNI